MRFKSLSTLAAAISILIASGATYGQAKVSTARNNPYSPSPNVVGLLQPDEEITRRSAVPASVGVTTQLHVQRSPQTNAAANGKASAGAPRPTQPTNSADGVYKLGTGDVLSIVFRQQGAGNVTRTLSIRPDGTIDLAMSSTPIRAAGMTTREVETAIRKAERPASGSQVEVRVQEFNSHKIEVTGLVQFPCELSLQREAMPFFAIKAQVGVLPQATRAFVTRAGASKREVYSLSVTETDNVLLYSGDKIEFASDGN